MKHKLGATGDFPEGKLNEQDKGGLKLAVGVKNGKVIVHFGNEPVLWIGMNPEDARQLAAFLIYKANLADPQS